jgi:hypothetical protein
MKSVSRRITVFLFISVYLYSSVLVAGGRGPFALYEEFWSCHCSDLSSEDDDSKESADLSELPALKGSNPVLSVIKNNIDDLNDPDICRSSNSTKKSGTVINNSKTSKDTEAPDICKRKLPLRYTDVLISNSLACIDPIPFALIKPDIHNIEIFLFYKSSQRAGYPVSLLRPPRFV